MATPIIKMFYVAMSKKHPGCGKASCVDEPTSDWGRNLITMFYADYQGHEIRHVDGDEMARLMKDGAAAYGFSGLALPGKPLPKEMVDLAIKSISEPE